MKNGLSNQFSIFLGTKIQLVVAVLKEVRGLGSINNLDVDSSSFWTLYH
jgi:hypothetical protein